MPVKRGFKRLETSIGPYEVWNFGPGVRYGDLDATSTEGEAPKRLVHAALLEWDEPVAFDHVRSKLRRGVHPYADTVAKAGGDPTVVRRKKRSRVVAAIASPPERLSGLLSFLPLVLLTPVDVTKEKGDTNEEEDAASAGGGEPRGRIRVNHPIPTAALNADFAPAERPDIATPSVPDATPLVVVGVIDDGLPFAHGAFLGTDNRTRVDYCWVQAARNTGQTAVAFGGELTGADIDALRLLHARSPAVAPPAQTDEDALYADPDALATSLDEDIGRNIFRNYTHGAHVMEMAGGFGPEDVGYETRDDVRVVGVQLPRGALRDTSGFGKDVFILAAIHYVLDRAERIAAAHPGRRVEAWINVSLGISGGPKNGRHQLERAIDDVVSAYRAPPPGEPGDAPLSVIKVVLPSGNNFASRLNAVMPWPAPSETSTVGWRLQPNDRTVSYLELWMEDIAGPSLPDIAADLSLEVTAPDGSALTATLTESAADHIWGPLTQADTAMGQVSLDRHAGRLRYCIAVAPTAHEPEHPATPEATAPAGLWTVSLVHRDGSAQLADAGPVAVRIQRDEDPAGTDNGGRQSYFDDPALSIRDPHAFNPYDERGRPIAPPHDPREGHAEITGFGSINGWATRDSGDAADAARISVAGFVAAKAPAASGADDSTVIAEPSLYSGAGPDIAGTPPTVDRSARADRSIALLGVRGAGSRTGSTTVLVGTSAAAPRYVRWSILKALGHDVASIPVAADDLARLGEAVTLER